MLILNFFFNGSFGFKHRLYQANNILMFEFVVERIDMTTNVLWNQAKCLSDPESKLPNFKLAVKEYRIDLNAVEQVFHIVSHLGQFGNFSLVFRIDRVEFFIDAVQLFVGTLQFLVRGNQFLIGRLHFFIGRLQIQNRVMQALTCTLQLLFEELNSFQTGGIMLHQRCWS